MTSTMEIIEIINRTGAKIKILKTEERPKKQKATKFLSNKKMSRFNDASILQRY